MRRSTMKFFLLLAVMAIASLVMPTPAITALLDMGPVVTQELNSTPPGHGFPLWYRDTNRVPLELCLSKAASANGPMCLTAEPNPGAPFSFPDNIGDEVFWWAAGTQMAVPGGGDARLDLAIEGAYSTGGVAPGAQISFARIRVRVDTPSIGTYTITHPYGELEFTVTADTLGDGINYTEDIGIAEGGIFTGALNGKIGPFLYCTNAPIIVGGESFVGDPNVTCSVLGSTFPSAQNPSNFFRVRGPNDLDIQTTQFNIMGKIYTDPIPTPLTADKATYARDTTGMQVNVFATTQALSNQADQGAQFPANFALTDAPSALQVTGTGIPTKEMTTNNPADGKFFSASGLFATPGSIPETVTVTNTADTPVTSIDVPLVDEVVIQNATYHPVSKVLSITAASHDKVAQPALQAFLSDETVESGKVLLGTLSNDQLSVTFPTTVSGKTYNVPGHDITVTSALGGSATSQVVTFIPPQLPPVTGVTLTGYPSSPQLLGTNIAFIATSTGGSGVEYEFWVSRNGGAWSTVQGYSTTNTLTWTPAQAGSYVVHVRARSAGSVQAYEAFANQNFTIYVQAVASVSLTPDAASPQLSGTTINFTANATGGVAPAQYEFWVSRNGGAWSTIQSYSTTNTLSWTPAQAGSYVVHVRARSAGSAAAYEAVANQNFTINVPAVASVSLTPNVASPQLSGATVNFTASATGGVAPVQYEFWVSRNGGAWSTVQSYSTTSTLSWTPAQAGSYVVHVRARSAGSAVVYEAFTNQNYTITVPPVASVSMTSDVASPQLNGATINFTANATGGVAPVQYEFWVSRNGGAWSTVQSYSTTNTLSWTPAQAGSYVVHVRARSAGSTLAYEAIFNQNYTIN